MAIRRRTANSNSNLYLQAAANLGLSFEVLDFERGAYRISREELSVEGVDARLKVNSYIFCMIAANKQSTMHILGRFGVPVTRCEIRHVEESVTELLRSARNQYPLVVKPVYGIGGSGVTANIRNETELRAAIRRLRDLGKVKFILENHVSGSDYRVLMCRGEVLDIVERIVANVVGDGRTPLEMLIREKNAARRARYRAIAEIEIDAELELHIGSLGLSLESIPVPGEIVYLRRVCSYSRGGEMRRVPLAEVHPENHALFMKIQELINLDICGIDFISADIRAPHGVVECCVNEVNHNPGMHLHCLAGGDGVETEVPEAVLSRLFRL
jgi:cyanophycin synthetase